jgi:hypothetical protein
MIDDKNSLQPIFATQSTHDKHPYSKTLIFALLQSVDEEIGLLALVGVSSSRFCVPWLGSLSVALGLASIFSPEVPPHEGSKESCEDVVRQQDSMSLEVSRALLSWVDEGGDASTGVTERDDDGSANTLLEGSTDIVGAE